MAADAPQASESALNAAAADPDATTNLTATDRVYDGLYRAILEGRIRPGMRLREQELAIGHAVSRTVVRQALQRLAQDRLVSLQHNRGAQVAAPTREQAAQVFDARRVVECEIARRLGGKLTVPQLDGLRRLQALESAADHRGDRPAAIRLSGEFHRALAGISGNPWFLRVLDELLPTTSLLLALYPPAAGTGCAAHRHGELLAALQRSGAAAAAEMRRHLREIESSLPAPEKRGHRRPAAGRGE